MKPIWKVVFGVGVSFFFIWWVLRGEDIGQIIAHISQANLWYLSASIIVGTAGYLIRALRWKVLLEPVNRDTGLRSRFAAICIGFATNNVFPARLGEIVRAFALNRAEQQVKVSGALGSVVVERLLDAIVLVSMFLVPMALPSFPGASDFLVGTVGTILNTTFIMLAVLIVGILALLIFPNPIIGFAENICERLSNPLRQKVILSLKSFLNALEVLKYPKLLTKAFFWTLGFWLWHSWSFWLGMRAFGIDLGLDAAIFTMAMVGFAIAIPAAPGFFGTFQIGADLALNGVYGVAAPATLAFAFGYHISGFFPVTIIGFYYAWKLGFSVAEVRGSKDRVKQAVEYQAPETSTEYNNNEVEISDNV